MENAKAEAYHLTQLCFGAMCQRCKQSMESETCEGMCDARNNNLAYQEMCNHVHVDKKWFCMTVDGECHLLEPGEEPPQT